jgi:hypothetical protein
MQVMATVTTNNTATTPITAASMAVVASDWLSNVGVLGALTPHPNWGRSVFW